MQNEWLNSPFWKHFLQFKTGLKMKAYSHTLEPHRKIAVFFFFIVSFMDCLFKPNIFIFPSMKKNPAVSHLPPLQTERLCCTSFCWNDSDQTQLLPAGVWPLPNPARKFCDEVNNTLFYGHISMGSTLPCSKQTVWEGCLVCFGWLSFLFLNDFRSDQKLTTEWICDLVQSSGLFAKLQ
jgi:hypothetical protein